MGFQYDCNPFLQQSLIIPLKGTCISFFIAKPQLLPGVFVVVAWGGLFMLSFLNQSLAAAQTSGHITWKFVAVSKSIISKTRCYELHSRFQDKSSF
jgi:hypothetical protein